MNMLNYTHMLKEYCQYFEVPICVKRHFQRWYMLNLIRVTINIWTFAIDFDDKEH